jgi:hypothetical protein
MDIAVEDTHAARRSGAEDAPPGAGQSGEGARSAMEKLIQLERKRDAQLPREGGGAPAVPADRRS